MLKGIDPLLNADILYALRAMGHGDDLIIADTNFPSDSVARQTVLGKLLRIDAVTAGRAAKAILSVMPLDAFVEKPALRMEIVGKPDEVPPVQAEVQKEIDAAEGRVLADGLDRALRLLRPRAKRPIASSRPASGASTAASSSRRASSRPTRPERAPARWQTTSVASRSSAFSSPTSRSGRTVSPRSARRIIGSGFKLGPGGKGSNQSVAAARVGADVTFISKIGKDEFGAIALATWKKEGVKARVAEIGRRADRRRLHLRQRHRPATTRSSSCRAPADRSRRPTSMRPPTRSAAPPSSSRSSSSRSSAAKRGLEIAQSGRRRHRLQSRAGGSGRRRDLSALRLRHAERERGERF